MNVSPDNGQYSVNLGVISGVIDEPILVFLGLLGICGYHLYLFWIKCRQTITNSINFHKVEDVYMFELAALHAFHEWNRLTRQYVTRKNMAVGSFTTSPKNPKEKGAWKVRAEIQSTRINEESEFLTALTQSDKFEISEFAGISQIDYMYSPKEEDNQYLNIHKDHFWITKKCEFVEHVLPLILGYVSFCLLVYRISSLYLE